MRHAFLYLCLYLLSMPFTAIYDSFAMTVLIDLLMPIIVNFIYCKWVCHPIVELREDCNRINGVLLTILIIAECLFLLRIAGFLFIESHVELKKFDVYFFCLQFYLCSICSDVRVFSDYYYCAEYQVSAGK